MLADGHGVLARYAQDFLDLADGQAFVVAKLGPDQFSRSGFAVGVQEHTVAETRQVSLVHAQFDDGPQLLLADIELPRQVGHGRRCQAGRPERGDDGVAQTALCLGQGRLEPGQRDGAVIARHRPLTKQAVRDTQHGGANPVTEPVNRGGYRDGGHPRPGVGGTRAVKPYGSDKVMRPGLYRPLRQGPTRGFSVALRVRGDSEAVMAQARAITTDMDSELPLYNIRNMTEQVDKSLFTRRAMSWLIGAFSTVALLLAVAGLYGVISYSLGQRTNEISARMAVGAPPHALLAPRVRPGMLLVALGVVGRLLRAPARGVRRGGGERRPKRIVYPFAWQNTAIGTQALYEEVVEASRRPAARSASR